MIDNELIKDLIRLFSDGDSFGLEDLYYAFQYSYAKDYGIDFERFSNLVTKLIESGVLKKSEDTLFISQDWKEYQTFNNSETQETSSTDFEVGYKIRCSASIKGISDVGSFYDKIEKQIHKWKSNNHRYKFEILQKSRFVLKIRGNILQGVDIECNFQEEFFHFEVTENLYSSLSKEIRNTIIKRIGSSIISRPNKNQLRDEYESIIEDHLPSGLLLLSGITSASRLFIEELENIAKTVNEDSRISIEVFDIDTW